MHAVPRPAAARVRARVRALRVLPVAVFLALAAAQVWGGQPMRGFDAFATTAHALGPGVGLLLGTDGGQAGGDRARADERPARDGAMAGLLEGGWRMTGDRLECRLEHRLAGGGRARFVRAAGAAQFFIALPRPAPRPGTAEITAELPPWHRNYPRDSRIGSLRWRGEAAPASGRVTAPDVLAAIRAALRAGKVVGISADADPAAVIRIGAMRFSAADADFSRCVARLSPVSFAQVERTSVHFAVDRATLNPRDARRLDRVARYSKLDPQVRQMVVDGHTDRTGTLPHNEALSVARSAATAKYLLDHGVGAERLIQRSHAYRWPVANNRTKAGRGLNRRATVRLLRGAALARTPATGAAGASGTGAAGAPGTGVAEARAGAGAAAPGAGPAADRPRPATATATAPATAAGAPRAGSVPAPLPAGGSVPRTP